MAHVLVTGSSGTLGTELVLRLIKEGHEVTGVDCVPNRWSDRVDERTIELDLCDADIESRLPADVDQIVHFAANARVYKLIEDPEKARENLVTTFEILEYARRTSADVIFGSSREVYGNREKIVASEEETNVDQCENPYSASKIGGEALVKSYENCYDIRTTIIRFSNVYGRYDVSDRVVPLFISKAARDRSLQIFGANKIIDFTYIDDCIAGVLSVIGNIHKTQGETFNIASGKGYSLLELAEFIREMMDSDSNIEPSSSQTGEMSRFVADQTKARRILGYEPEYDLEAGIEETLQWYDERDLFDEVLKADNW